MRTTIGACVLAVSLAACGNASKAHPADNATTGSASTSATVASAPQAPIPGPGSIPGDAVAEVGGHPITEALLDHWMPILAAQDLYRGFSVVLAKKLVFDRPGYSVCAADLKAIQMQYKTQHSASKLKSMHDLRTSCEQLDVAMRQQTAKYLIDSELSAGEAAEQGIKITDAEVAQELRKVKAEEFPTEAALQQYLARHGLTFADELYEVRRNLLDNRLIERLTELGSRAAPVIRKWAALTECRPGYVVEECRQYRTAAATPSPSVVMEDLFKSPEASSK